MLESCKVKVIVIDPGHGGKDPGAVCGALVEKQINWALANAVNDILNGTFIVDSRVVQPSAANPKSTSQDELTIPPMEANRLRADIFISFHVNAGGGTGFESYTKQSRRDHALRKVIHNQIVKYLGPLGVVDRGMKFANFKVLRLAKVPAMLFEFCL